VRFAASSGPIMPLRLASVSIFRTAESRTLTPKSADKTIQTYACTTMVPFLILVPALHGTSPGRSR
jgi:hypothetical protein